MSHISYCRPDDRVPELSGQHHREERRADPEEPPTSREHPETGRETTATARHPVERSGGAEIQQHPVVGECPIDGHSV